MKIIFLSLFIVFSASANIGNIMALKGKADVYRVQNKVLSASSGMPLILGDKIVTSDKTRVQIILKDDTIVTVGANTSFQFDQFFFDGSKKSTLKMRANRGFFRAVTGKIGKVAPERFTVDTSSATIGIRGTDFSALINKTLESFKCYSGTIHITIGDFTKVLQAGDIYEIVPPKVEVMQKNIKKVEKQHFEPKVTEVSDITEVDQSEHVTPILPGIPAEPCFPEKTPRGSNSEGY